MSHEPRTNKFPPIILIPPDSIANVNIRAYLKVSGEELFRMGLLNIWRKHHGNDEWDLSISHPKRYPTWDEIAHARFALLPPDRCYALLLPPNQDFISVAPNMFHLTEVYTRDQAKAGDHLYSLGDRRTIDPNIAQAAYNAALPQDKPKMIRYLQGE